MKSRLALSCVLIAEISCSATPQVESFVKISSNNPDAGVTDGGELEEGEYAGSQMSFTEWHLGEICPNLSNIQVGELIGNSTLTKRYYVGAISHEYAGWICRAYLFPNQATYSTWYLGDAEILIPSSNVLETFLSNGYGIVTYRPGARILKLDVDDFAIYVVARGRIIRRVTWSEIGMLYGPNWVWLVDELPCAFLQYYVEGSDLNCPVMDGSPNCTEVYKPAEQMSGSNINFELYN